MLPNTQVQQLSDEAHMLNNTAITGQFEPGEKVIFSSNISKHNKRSVVQQRVFLLTNRYIYNLAPGDALIKIASIFRSAAIIRRKIAIANLTAITVSSYTSSDQFIIHVAKEYDYRFSGIQKKREAILRAICKEYRETTGEKLPFYFIKEENLGAFQTTDDDSKVKRSKIPKESPMMLSDQDLQMGLEYFIKLSQDPNQFGQNKIQQGYPTQSDLNQGNVQQGYPTQNELNQPKNENNAGPGGPNGTFEYKATIQDNNVPTKMNFSSSLKLAEEPPKQQQQPQPQPQPQNYNYNPYQQGQMQPQYQSGQMQPQYQQQPQFVNGQGFNPNVYNPQGLKMANVNQTTSVYVVKRF